MVEGGTPVHQGEVEWPLKKRDMELSEARKEREETGCYFFGCPCSCSWAFETKAPSCLECLLGDEITKTRAGPRIAAGKSPPGPVRPSSLACYDKAMRERGAFLKWKDVGITKSHIRGCGWEP